MDILLNQLIMVNMKSKLKAHFMLYILVDFFTKLYLISIDLNNGVNS